MGWAFWALAGALLAVGVLAVVLAVLLRAARRRSRNELAAAVAEHRALEARVDELSRRLVTHPPRQPPARAESADWVVTWGDGSEREIPVRPVSNQVVLSAAFGEPLVRVLAFGHGLRRALSAESRNRIGFEVRREMRRSRKVRRREMRDAWRQMRAHEREDVA
ncbi:MAG: hypothetical protein M3Y66_02375 [Actinomycetota bacterium]|nr:hypothetical protein [Actinomycetota bacterium]